MRFKPYTLKHLGQEYLILEYIYHSEAVLLGEAYLILQNFDVCTIYYWLQENIKL